MRQAPPHRGNQGPAGRGNKGPVLSGLSIFHENLEIWKSPIFKYVSSSPKFLVNIVLLKQARGPEWASSPQFIIPGVGPFRGIPLLTVCHWMCLEMALGIPWWAFLPHWDVIYYLGPGGQML